MESPFILLSIKLATKQLFDEGKVTYQEYNYVTELANEAESLRKRFNKTTQILDDAINQLNQAMHDRKAEQEESSFCRCLDTDSDISCSNHCDERNRGKAEQEEANHGS